MTQPKTSPHRKTRDTLGSATPKKGTKAEAVIKLLGSKRGATIDDLSKLTGWQAHSVRGFLSATVKRRMALKIVSEHDKDGVRHYRILREEAVDRAATNA